MDYYKGLFADIDLDGNDDQDRSVLDTIAQVLTEQLNAYILQFKNKDGLFADLTD